MKIMIVDDSSAMRMMVKKTLRLAGFEGHEISEADDGAKALAAIKKSAPDLVLCDWNMPNMTGLQLLEMLAADVTRAPAPDRPIDGGLATEALLAHVLVSKYADHLPRYRQAPDPRVKPVGMPSPRIERRDEPANIVQPPAEPTGHFFTMPSKPKNQRSVGNRQVSTLDVDRHR